MVTPADLELLNLKNDWVVESGEFKVMIGASSEDIRLEKPFMVLPYNELNIQKKIIPNEALLPILIWKLTGQVKREIILTYRWILMPVRIE